MDTVAYPALSDDDRPLIDRFTVGLGGDAAQVLAYLRLRLDRPETAGEPATRLAIRIGTGLSRGAVGDALDTLEALGLVTATSVRRHESGRPPQAWTTEESVTPRWVYGLHADQLLDRADEVTGAADGSATATRASDAGAESLTVGLNWHPNALHAPLYAGRAHGHYDDGDLDVAFDPRTGSAAALDALAAGDVDVALAGAATLVARDETEFVPLALLYERAMAVLYTTREAFGGPFERVQQLRGRRVGMSTGSETARLARLLLSKVDSLSAVEVVDLDGEERAALQSGRVDAVTGQVSDPGQLDAPDQTVDVLPVAKQFPLYGPALVTTDAVLDARAGAVRAFLVGTMCGWADAAESPSEAADCVPGSEGRDQETVSEAISEFGFDTDHGWGNHTESGWERLRTALAQIDLPE